MKYFKLSYNHISREYGIYAESYDQGLELKLGQYFLNPQTQTYNIELADRLFQEKERQIRELAELEPIDKKKYRAQSILAMILYAIKNPNTTYKAGQQFLKKENQ